MERNATIWLHLEIPINPSTTTAPAFEKNTAATTPMMIDAIDMISRMKPRNANRSVATSITAMQTMSKVFNLPVRSFALFVATLLRFARSHP